MIACVSSTTALAKEGIYNFSLMTGNVGYTKYISKDDTRNKGCVTCYKVSKPKATMKYRVRNQSYLEVANTSKKGVGSAQFEYKNGKNKKGKYSLGVENLATNGGVTIDTNGFWYP